MTRAAARTRLCLQPSNVLLNSECQVKMADFGLARSVAQLQTEEGNPVLTDYVATRWYRAPEILLSSHRYTYGVDMWACGAWVGWGGLRLWEPVGATCQQQGPNNWAAWPKPMPGS